MYQNDFGANSKEKEGSIFDVDLEVTAKKDMC